MTQPASDHVGLTDTYASRRYFRKFEAITGHLARVAGLMEVDGALAKPELAILVRHVTALTYTFRALSMKYLLAGRDTGRFFGSLAMDVTESGFPVATELMTMANDAQQAARHLANMPDAQAIKSEMVETIVADREIPTRLQFALSQRLYYEELARGNLFWVRNDPDCTWIENIAERRRRFLLHWSVYDSQTNLPVVYILEVEDSGRTALPKDQHRWPEVQAHLMAQASSALKLLTIAQGFDTDFDDLHPKRLRRFHLGPMYSSTFTRQTGPMHDVMQQARAPEGQDWALVWTAEMLESERMQTEKAGWFSTVEREIFALDPFAGRGAETGATETRRSIILPQRPFQVLAERAPPGFADVRKYVVGPGGGVLRY